MPGPFWHPGDENHMPGWVWQGPITRDDIENLIYVNGSKQFYNLIITGIPCKISPRWLAQHPDYKQGKYDYAVSYVMDKSTIGYVVDEYWPTDEEGNYEELGMEEAFDHYLEDIELDNCWIEIYSIELVDRTPRG